jgi:starch phosphorylase
MRLARHVRRATGKELRTNVLWGNSPASVGGSTTDAGARSPQYCSTLKGVRRGVERASRWECGVNEVHVETLRGLAAAPLRSKIAYFSMEIALESAMPTYSGGLGILAGDTLRAAADLHLPLVAVTLLHREGYFRQRLDASGGQTEESDSWNPQEFLTELPARVQVMVEQRLVAIRAWLYQVTGADGATVPVYLLDTDVPENSAYDRSLTNRLYGGDARYRLLQEVVLGTGGVRMLRALGHMEIEQFHLNEGHAALITLELLDEAARACGRTTISDEDIADVRSRCVFTTHTPVAAGA